MNSPKGAPAQTLNAQRQRDFRAKKKEANLHEVRGIFATKEHAKKIKEFAESLDKSC